MPVRCQDCNSHFLLDGTTVAQGIGCPDCGGTKIERDQPSPTHSDGELRNMVDPATQLDQGGNPLQEGVWAGVDGGWQPAYKRDEFFSKVAAFPRLDPSGLEPQYHGTAQPSPRGGIHNRNMELLHFLDASINGDPVRTHWNEIYANHGYPNKNKWGEPVTVSVHHPEHLDAAIEVAENPDVNGGLSMEQLSAMAPKFSALGSAMKRGLAPLPNGLGPPKPPQVMSNHYSRSLPQDPYLPWYHQADVQRYPGDGGAPVTLTNDEWATDKKNRYEDRLRDQHRLGWKPGQDGRGIMIGNQLHTWPVQKTMDDPQGGLMHGEYVSQLGVNPQNVDFSTGFEIGPDGKMIGNNIDPKVTQIDPFLNQGQGGEDWGSAFGSTKKSFLPALAPLAEPLIAAGGRALLGQAIGGLMRKAIGGQGNFTQQAPQDLNAPDVSLVASQHTAVGVAAPVETPGSIPERIETHDPEAVDQQEFNDGDASPAFNNPNRDNADAGMAQSVGEDGVNQKLEFRHDGEAVQHAEMLLPKILEYINSDKSALENPHLKALHEALEAEIPGYLDHADENDESVHKLLESLKGPDHVQAATKESIVPPTTPQMQLQNQGVAGPAMPGTFQNPVQPGGMPVSGKCQNCGGVLNADGSCPQCGAAPGANQLGNMGQQGPVPQQTPLGIMPSPYASTKEAWGLPEGHGVLGPQSPEEFALTNPEQNREVSSCPHCGAVTRFPLGVCPHCGMHTDERTAADHQGPITPQQKEVFAQYLIEQGRNDEVAAMMENPALYADEWAQYINKPTQPPEVDPAQQAPQPQMDPSQMGQMPVPPMSIPQPTGSTKTADNPRRCPKCESATTTVMNTDGDMRCHRCGNIWKVEVTEDHPVVKSNWVVKSAPAPGGTGEYRDGDSPNPVAAPAADATAPGDRENQQDSTLSWQSDDGTPLQVGQTYEMHNPGYAIPDVVKVEQVKPDSIVVTMEGEYNSPSDPQDANGPGYTHEITLQEAQTEGLTFNPVDSGEGDQEQSQDQNHQDGIGQTVNTEPVEQPHGDFPLHAKTALMNDGQPFGPTTQCPHCGQEASVPGVGPNHLCPHCNQPLVSPPKIPWNEVTQGPYHAATDAATLPTDQCPKCEYGHVTSSYNSPTEIQYECFRCAHQWKVADVDEDSGLNPESRNWLNESSSEDFNFDRVVAMESLSSSSQGRNIHDIAKRDPRNAEVRERLNKNAGAKFSPREQKEFIDEDGVARNADRLNLDGTHYVESAFDNSKARPDRVNDNYLGLGL